jgi:hypothetical protein
MMLKHANLLVCSIVSRFLLDSRLRESCRESIFLISLPTYKTLIRVIVIKSAAVFKLFTNRTFTDNKNQIISLTKNNLLGYITINELDFFE